MEIGEIAAAAAGDKDLASRLAVVFHQSHSPSAPASHRRTHQPRRARAQNNHIELARRRAHG
jgi:hypothetical protein